MEKTINTRNGRFKIRPYELSDRDSVLSLWKTAFGKVIHPQVWKWKFEHNPFGYRIMLCLNENNKPVVMFAAQPYQVLWQGKKSSILHAVDNMSHPDYRGAISGRRGLFIRTAEYFFETYTGPEQSIFVYGFPGQRHFRLGSIMLGYTELPAKIAYLEAAPGNLKKGIRLFGGKISPEYSVGEEFNYMAVAMSEEYPFAVFRGAEFINWRFFDHPDGHYLFFAYRSFMSGSLRGYLVLKLQGTEALIVDILLPAKQAYISDFIGRVFNDARIKNVNKVKVWLAGEHFLADLLQKVGFYPLPEPVGFVPTALSSTFHPELNYCWAVNNIYYTMADGDLF